MADGNYEIRPESGTLFRNTSKVDAMKKGNGNAQKWPDYRGKCMVNGTLMEMSGWMKTSKAGTAFMSIAFRTPRDEFDQRPESEQPQPPAEDNLPF